MRFAVVLGAVALGALAAHGQATAAPAARFSAMAGAALGLPTEPAASGAADTAGRRFTGSLALELAANLRLSGPLWLVLGSAGWLSPFVLADCPGDASAGRRPSALGAFAGLRLEPLPRSRVSPWLALRAGIAAQDGVASPLSENGLAGCAERVQVRFLASPRLGLDLRLTPGARTALSVALGYDHLPRGGVVTILLGLSLPLR